jgi:hypothetical protein
LLVYQDREGFLSDQIRQLLEGIFRLQKRCTM